MEPEVLLRLLDLGMSLDDGDDGVIRHDEIYEKEGTNEVNEPSSRMSKCRRVDASK